MSNHKTAPEIDSNNISKNNSNNRSDGFSDQVIASASIPTATVQANALRIERKKCIFKTHDDCGQDPLALQAMALLKIWEESGLELYILLYEVIATRSSNDRVIGGIIECVPNSCSRNDTIWELKRYFKKIKGGSEDCNAFHIVQINFKLSITAYAVARYLLQISNRGHVTHIHFGFIFDVSPGKNIGFETAGFNITEETVNLICGCNIFNSNNSSSNNNNNNNTSYNFDTHLIKIVIQIIMLQVSLLLVV